MAWEILGEASYRGFLFAEGVVSCITVADQVRLEGQMSGDRIQLNIVLTSHCQG